MLAGCEKQASSPPHNEAQAVSAPGPREVPIENVPGLQMGGYAKAQRDCRPSVVARRRFAGVAVRACGVIALATDDDWEHARDYKAVAKKIRPLVDCAAVAIAARRPFIVEQQVAGTDSGVARGLVGVLENGTLAVYALLYDSNPCGGGCPERGHTTVSRCDEATAAPAAECAELTECFHCNLERTLEDCEYGGPPP